LTNEKIRDDFLVFTAGDCMDVGIRETQEQLPRCGLNTVLNNKFTRVFKLPSLKISKM